jgi:hypothetical protein
MISVVAGLFLTVVGANLIIDPQAVFGTGLFGRAPNANDRYERLQAYRADPGRFDSLLFGSSRSFVFPLDEVSRRMDARFATFAVVGGTLSDHVPTLEYVLRDKILRGERLRAVFLQLDIDGLGNRPFTNQGLQYVLPPEISGEDRIHYWWKFLTAIQFKAWHSAITGISMHRQAVNAPAAPSLPGAIAGALADLVLPPQARAEGIAGNATHGHDAPERITQRPYFDRQTALLQRLVALCRDNDVRLLVVAAPIGRASAERLDKPDLLETIDRVSRIVPLWDFTLAHQAVDHPEFWSDGFHFRSNIAALMVDRIFGKPLPPGWADFGTFRSPTQQSGRLPRTYRLAATPRT